jgi:diguanylate cyclase (GGDEF)-like protein
MARAPHQAPGHVASAAVGMKLTRGRYWIRCLLLGLALAAQHGVGCAAETTDELIERALQLRSAAPDRFDAVLAELDTRMPDADDRQRRYTRFLHAYKLTFSGDFLGSNRELATLVEPPTPDELRVRAAAMMVNNFAATRQFSEGLAALDSLMPLLDQTAEREPRHQGLLAASIFYNQLGQFEMGLRQAERILAEKASPRSLCMAEALRTEALVGQKSAPTEDSEFVRVVSQCTAAGELAIAGFVGILLARKMHAEQRIEDAIEVLEAQASSISGTRYPRLIGENHALLAELEYASGNWEAAERHARSAVQFSAGTLYSLPLVAAERTLYQLAERRGDLTAALDHFRSYAAADKAYLDDVKARELAFQLARHESLQKSQTIELLNRRNEILQLEQQVARRTSQAFGLFAALLALLTASITFWAFKVNRLQQAFRKLAETDMLTGLSNRSHFTHAAQATLAECRKSSLRATLIMFDLDNFKSINDRFGHAVGDWVLRRIADVAREVGAREASTGRLGGEEFAILMQGADMKEAAALAERCRQAFGAIDAGESGHHFRISASFGIADTDTAGYDFQKLMIQADQAMYRAKQDGRDRVGTFGMQD